MIEVTGLVKRYGPKTAVDHIDFSVAEGEVVGFLGPNGAGKSTTMNVLTGYISSTEGSVKIDGYDVLENPIEVKRRIGYLPENPPLYMDMTVMEYLRFSCRIKGVSKPHDRHINELCELTGLEQVKGRLIRNLSKGYKQRTGLAYALLGYPGTVILDEPTVGLDPIQIIEVRNIIRELGQRATVILSSHILAEVQSICKRVLVINEGKICADGRIEELSRQVNQNHAVELRVAGERESVEHALQGIEGLVEMRQLPTQEEGALDYALSAREDVDLRAEAFRAVSQAGHTLLLLKNAGMSLEELFLKLTVKGEI